MDIPVDSKTKTETLIESLGWKTRPSGDGSNLAVQTCPINPSHSEYKFYVAIGGEKDGLWNCHVCGQHGNYYQLKQQAGVSVPNVTSMHDAAAAKTGPQPLLNFDACHKRLMEDENFGDVLDYLIAERKFSLETIERLKLGATTLAFKVKENDEEVKRDFKCYVIPYFDKAGNQVYYKCRTVPPAPKKFAAPAGREARLYNEAALKAGLEEIVLVEGEADCIALLNAGYENVIGIPGVANKKATWIDLLDKMAPKTIYLLYDRDKPGQDAARDMAARIGLDKVKNILLPEFEISEGKQGKDINEFLNAGHDLEDFYELQVQAKPFDVEGVQSVVDVLNDLKAEIEEKGTQPTFDTPWEPLTKRLGGAEPGDVIGLMAEGKVGKTTMALDWLQYYSEGGTNCLMYCDEMPAKRMVRKWVSHVTQTPDTPGASQITTDTIDKSIIIGGNMPGDILFAHSVGAAKKKSDIVFNTIRQAVRRYGVKVVCYDNLQLLVRSVENSQQETSIITKQFKELAMELGIVIILIIQPHRVAEGQIVSARNAAGSSAIEKDVDAMVCLHRNRMGKIKETEFNGYMDTEENFEPAMLVRVDLSRYAPGGTCTLIMDGATSTVRTFMEGDIITPTAPKAAGGIPVEEPVAV